MCVPSLGSTDRYKHSSTIPSNYTHSLSLNASRTRSSAGEASAGCPPFLSPSQRARALSTQPESQRNKSQRARSLACFSRRSKFKNAPYMGIIEYFRCRTGARTPSKQLQLGRAPKNVWAFRGSHKGNVSTTNTNSSFKKSASKCKNTRHIHKCGLACVHMCSVPNAHPRHTHAQRQQGQTSIPFFTVVFEGIAPRFVVLMRQECSGGNDKRTVYVVWKRAGAEHT